MRGDIVNQLFCWSEPYLALTLLGSYLTDLIMQTFVAAK
jgi:hypothetical protein